jgi:flagellar basal body-associated protein FliL
MGNLLIGLSIVLLAIGVVIFTVFRKNTVEEARSRVAHVVIVAVSWPARFFTYRSGHGKHAYV